MKTEDGEATVNQSAPGYAFSPESCLLKAGL